MAKESKSNYHHGNLRAALVEAAARLVELKGIRGFSLREAAREAGVSASAPYRHFEDRAALLTAVAEEAMLRLKETTIEELTRAGEDKLSQFRALGLAYVRFAISNPAHFKVMNDPEFADPSRSELIRQIDDESRVLVKGAIAAAKEGDLKVGLPDSVIELAATTMMYGVARRFVDGHFARAGVGLEEAEAMADLMMDVLGVGIGDLSGG